MRIWCVLIQSLKSAPLGCKVIQCSKQCYSVAQGSVFLLIWDLSIVLFQLALAVVSVSDLWQSLIRQTLATTLVSLHTSYIVPQVHWSWTWPKGVLDWEHVTAAWAVMVQSWTAVPGGMSVSVWLSLHSCSHIIGACLWQQHSTKTFFYKHKKRH